MANAAEAFDVLIIGAGLSGVGAGCHLQQKCAGKSFAILEARDAIGGTWDLFRYPGIRSDSDMYTLGYAFRPWREGKAIADGKSILNYVRETAAAYGVDQKIRYNHRVMEARWSTKDALWTVFVRVGDDTKTFQCRFLWMCAGYYEYSSGYAPDFKGAENFQGEIIHPQHWPQDADYADKKIIIIGSGATAVTLTPSLAEKAANVTMLQRSPSYIYAMPSISPMAAWLGKFVPEGAVNKLMRWQRIALQQITFKFARAKPAKTARSLISMVRKKLPEGYDVEKHFTPAYNPWTQRLCLVPDDDLFKVISSGAVDIVTGELDHFSPHGVMLKSGELLEADIIVTATGINLQAFGGAAIYVDNAKVNLSECFTYKGAMFTGVPNLVSIFGYINASWTLRSDLVSAYFCRLMSYMDKRGFAVCMPAAPPKGVKEEPYLDFSSGYVKRAKNVFPRQTTQAPWRHPQDYFVDMKSLRHERLDDGVMIFKTAQEAKRGADAKPAPALAAE